MNRRNFLKVAFAAGVVTAVPVAFKEIAKAALPTIWGDGAHDDTAGLQAALNGREFYCETDLVSIYGGQVFIRGGEFLLSSALKVHGADGTTIENCRIKSTALPFLDFRDCKRAVIHDNIFDYIGPPHEPPLPAFDFR